ncbi:hypothetical protein HAX54_023930 [Datura stramonium]|uniref:Uncharacterized protein n=1 Tax=Datura stramonium TaxID=4076 RepID=A0ABS8UZ50_DATST|nr:hypothetical protein [Datura stramonium]
MLFLTLSLGRDGYGSLFLHKAWDIVGGDMLKMVKVVPNGAFMPKYFTSTCLVLLPKAAAPQSFLEFRETNLVIPQRALISEGKESAGERVLPDTSPELEFIDHHIAFSKANVKNQSSISIQGQIW